MEFYVFSDAFDRTVPRLSMPLEAADYWIAAQRGKPVPDLVAQQCMGGRQWKDLLWTTLAVGPLISNRVRALLEDNGFTGWTTHRVAVFDPEGRDVPGYSGFGIIGRCRGRIGFDRRESALIYKPSAKGEPMPWFRSLQFDRESWDGTDFFMDEDRTGWKLVTDTVVKLFKKAKVRNCLFRRIEEVEMLATPSDIIRGEQASGE